MRVTIDLPTHRSQFTKIPQGCCVLPDLVGHPADSFKRCRSIHDFVKNCGRPYGSQNCHKSLARLDSHCDQTASCPARLASLFHAHDRCCIALALPSPNCGSSIRKSSSCSYGTRRMTACSGCGFLVFLFPHSCRCGRWHKSLA